MVRTPRTLARWLELYDSLGWTVIPLEPPDGTKNSGKRPARGLAWREVTRESAQAIWDQVGHAKCWNLALATGKPSGVVAFDADSPEASRLFRSFLAGPCDTLCHGTGKGMRFLFAHADPPLRTRTWMCEGGELRLLAEGALAVLPPSEHWSGRSYRWVPYHTPRSGVLRTLAASIDPSRLSLNKTPPIALDRASDGVILDGYRNTTLFRLAAALARHGAHPEDLRASLDLFNRRCVAEDGRTPYPLGPRELDTIARSAERYRPGPLPENVS